MGRKIGSSETTFHKTRPIIANNNVATVAIHFAKLFSLLHWIVRLWFFRQSVGVKWPINSADFQMRMIHQEESKKWFNYFSFPETKIWKVKICGHGQRVFCGHRGVTVRDCPEFDWHPVFSKPQTVLLTLIWIHQIMYVTSFIGGFPRFCIMGHDSWPYDEGQIIKCFIWLQ